ncbi:hypothetical protein [Fibrella aquatilis]|uniref:Uncharacterized protein n=1 Tax=Fibrella aquatilis TaxID=2817059 RepID=A0A939K3C0_9BACT|nr:hypothetical protein [Fibrella aquatilis]MBO0934195.1 hypothetical protein [Fibrella aquatilis]
MKNGYFFLLFTFGCLVGCRKADTVAPAPDGLYKRWKDAKADAYITFQREGIVLYGADGTDDFCCLYERFFRVAGNRLVFEGASSKPLPSNLKPVACANVSCYKPSTIPDWQIISLTTDRLVLNRGNGTDQTYIAAP